MAMPAAIWMSRSLSGNLSVQYVDESLLTWFCVTFRPHDKILLFPPSPQTIRLLRQTVETHWGLDSHTATPECYTFNLSGSPFLKHARRENALMVKRLCCAMLERLKGSGWELIACSDLSCSTDLTAWYFARTTLVPSPQRPPVRDPNARLLSSPALERRRSSALTDLGTLVCLSLSKKRKLQLIDAPDTLRDTFRRAVEFGYRPGVDQELQRGRDYELKLRGSPWNTADGQQLVAACRMLVSVFGHFSRDGYRFYGLVNFKETADCLFFEHDRAQPPDDDARFMIITLDSQDLMRVVGVCRRTARLLADAIADHWPEGLHEWRRVGERTAAGNATAAGFDQDDQFSDDGEHDAFEFRLRGSPWLAKASRIGKTRRLLTKLLDELLRDGWTLITGLDISRGINAKSALLFSSCPPVSLTHSCISPLGRNSLQIVNGSASLRRLIVQEFQKDCRSSGADSSPEHAGGGAGAGVGQQSGPETFFDGAEEIRVSGIKWDPHPEKEAVEYVQTRKQMGALLHRLTQAGWRLLASADVGHCQEDTDIGEGIHSWFIVSSNDDAGRRSHDTDRPDSPAIPQHLQQWPPSDQDHRCSTPVQTLMNVGARVGRRASAFAFALPVSCRRNTIIGPSTPTGPGVSQVSPSGSPANAKKFSLHR